MVKISAQVDLFPKMSPANPDCKLSGLGVHTLLLSLHSPLLKGIFETISDSSEIVVIVPDVKKSEIKSVLRVMYGIEEIGFVSSGTLDTLGLDSFKGFLVMEDLENPANEEVIDIEVVYSEENCEPSVNNAVIERTESTMFENNSFLEVVASPDNPDGNEKEKSQL